MPKPFEDPDVVARGSFVLKQYESDGQYRLTLVNLPQEISSDLQHYQQQPDVAWKWSGVAFWGGQTTREYSLSLGVPYVSPKREITYPAFDGDSGSQDYAQTPRPA